MIPIRRSTPLRYYNLEIKTTLIVLGLPVFAIDCSLISLEGVNRLESTAFGIVKVYYGLTLALSTKLSLQA
jgi:hypothetical protein